MNKKNYIAVGVFILIIGLGAGIAYYFDPAAINTIIGIDSAQINAVSDADLSAIDDASSSFPVDSSETSVDLGASAPTSTKKAASEKNIAAGAVPVVQQTDASDDDGATSSQDASSGDAIAIFASSCPFPASAPSTTTNKIIFNEIAWMGSPSSSTAEWMEIKNSSTSSVDLSGWQLSNASQKIKIIFSEGDALAPGALRLLSRESVTTSDSMTLSYSGDLVNTGDLLTIMDPQCAVSDYLDASHGWPGGNNTTKQTLERDAGDFGWHTSALPGGTPGAENSPDPVASPTSSAPMIIPTPTPTQAQAPPAENDAAPVNANASSSDGSDMSTTSSVATSSASSTPSSPETGEQNNDNPVPATHILIAAVQIGGASSTNDFVSLYNPTPAAVDVSGWKLHKKSQTGTDYSIKVFPAGSMIAAGQSFIWANSTDGFSEAVGANVSSTETLAADNSVALMDAAGDVIDAVAWGTGTDQYGEGPPYPTSPGANQLLSRRSSGGVMVDTENNINDFTIQ